MGTDTLPARSNGQTCVADFFNVFRNAFNQNFVARNSSGIATDVGGSLGTSTYRWGDSYLQKIFLGTVANGITFEEDGSGDIIVKRNSVQVGKFVAGGFDGSTIKAATIPKSAGVALGEQLSSSSGTFSTGLVTPVDVTNLSVSVTTGTGGRPVVIQTQPDGTSNQSWFGGAGGTGANPPSIQIDVVRDGSLIARSLLQCTYIPGSSYSIIAPPSIIKFVDNTVAASTTYTYKIQVAQYAGGGSFAAYAYYIKLLGYEMP